MRSCDLCQRPENEVKQIVELIKDGPCICNRCFGTAAGLMNAAQKPKEEPLLLKPKAIYSRLGDYVVGQDASRQDLSVAVYNHYKRRDAAKRGLLLQDVEIQKSNILILGPSGTGKTQMARTLARLLKVPFFVGDATRLTQTGYVGEDVETLVEGLVTAAGNDPEKAEWGIIFLDEVDKIARKSGREAAGYRDISGEAVQQALLKLLEGTQLTLSKGGLNGMGNETYTIDTSNILFICAGSFAGIEESVNRRKNKHVKVGFGSESRQQHTSAEAYLAIEEEDLLDFGLIPEMLGRIPVRTTTIPLTEDEMVRILTEPKDAIIRQVKALFEMDGIDLHFDDEALRAIGQKAIKSQTGARALRTIVERILKTYAFECPSDPTVKGIMITKAAVEGTAEAAILREPLEVQPLAIQAG